MAAGMGSRYAALTDRSGRQRRSYHHDFSIYDAKQAGFEKVIFIIKKANEKDFLKESIGDRIMAKIMDVDYAFQELTDLPEAFLFPKAVRNPSELLMQS